MERVIHTRSLTLLPPVALQAGAATRRRLPEEAPALRLVDRVELSNASRRLYEAPPPPSGEARLDDVRERLGQHAYEQPSVRREVAYRLAAVLRDAWA